MGGVLAAERAGVRERAEGAGSFAGPGRKISGRGEPRGSCSERGRTLLEKRSELVERTFAHLFGTGGLRRVHVRGLEEVRKRVLMRAAVFNLGLLMRRRFGVGAPRTVAAGPLRTLGPDQRAVLRLRRDFGCSGTGLGPSGGPWGASSRCVTALAALSFKL